MQKIQPQSKVYDQEKDRPKKDTPRRKAFAIIPEGTVVKCALVLTGKYCKDLVVGLEMERLNADTELVIFERDKSVVEIIKVTCKKLGFKKVTVIAKDFAKINKKVIDFLKSKVFDFVFLDFCGNMTLKKYENIKEIWGEDSKTTRFGFTFAARVRYNKYHIDNPGHRITF